MSRASQLILLSVLVIGSLSLDCGGNCVEGNCPECLCGMTPKKASVQTWCELYSWDTNCCACIAGKVSQGNLHAIKYNSDGTYDVGLLGINTKFWEMCNHKEAPCNPVDNLKCAIKVHRDAKSTFNHWPAAKECGCFVDTERSSSAFLEIF
jgi:hypothetical protein